MFARQQVALLRVLVLCLFSCFLIGCPDESPTESVDEVIEEIEDEAGDAVDAVEDEIDDAK